jgi:DNA-directed RNA polymerase specialized sigma24 family protein
VRHLAPRVDQRVAMGELVLVLDARVCTIARRFARGFDETTSEEIALEVGQAVMELMLGQEPERADFLEASFLLAVKGRVIDAADKRRRVAKPHEVAKAEAKRKNPKKYEIVEEAFGIDDATAADPQKHLLAAESEAMKPELIRKALDHIKNPKHREAVILHHLQGWPITDQDPEVDSLCHHFGVSDRQIREWIATAFAQMRRAIGETS